MLLAKKIQNNQGKKINELSSNCKIIDFNSIRNHKEVLNSETIHKEKYQNKKVYSPVEPFKTKEDLQQAKDYFLNRPERFSGQNIRDYSIFVFGINLWKRAGDLLHLRLHNVINEDGQIKDYITIREQKTGKISKDVITDVLRDVLEIYLPMLKHNNLNAPLFPSRNKDKNGNYKAMTVDNFYKKMKALEKELNLNYNIGTHTMRKTGAYHAYKKDPSSMVDISERLNHSSEGISYRYLGFKQERKNNLSINNQL